MADQTIDKQPKANQSVNKPESGTYGEQADLARLQEELPPMNRPGMGEATGGPAPMPQPDMQVPGRPGGRPPNLPAGVPDVLLGSQQEPTMGAPAGANVPPEAARISLLEQLVASPDVSEETREWAKAILEMLVGP